MKKKYIFYYKRFWITLIAIYIVFFLTSYVVIKTEVKFDIIQPKLEPIYHLLLRNIGLIDGGEYSSYNNSMAPILWQLPYSLIGFVILALILVIFSAIAQKAIYKLKKHDSAHNV